MDVGMKSSLDAIFNPKSIALIGASNNPDRWGHFTMKCLLEGGHNNIYPVHPKDPEVHGIKAYPNLAAIPETIDLAVIAVNSNLAPQIIQECIEQDVKSGILITAGFAEISEAGAKIQQQLAENARKAGFYFIGPNCRGIWSADGKVNTDMHMELVPPEGPISFISQSGTLAEYCFAAANRNGSGVSKYVNCGNMAQVTFNDLLEYFKDDQSTNVITGYVEDIKDGRRFIEVGKKVTAEKPVLLIKAGASEASARAAKSHTAAMAGNDAVFDAACRQAGIIRCQNINDMFDMADTICYAPKPAGNRVAILSGGGGFCVLTAEACSRHGLEVPVLTTDAQKAIRQHMESYSPHPVNPVDLIAPKTQESIIDIIEIIADQDNIDGIIYTPRLGRFDRSMNSQQMIHSIELAERLASIPQKFNKPLILAALIFEAQLMSGPIYEIYKRNHIPYFFDPESCAKAMSALVQYQALQTFTKGA
jgi:acyl-CoA synthetase (NDP forming)